MEHEAIIEHEVMVKVCEEGKLPSAGVTFLACTHDHHLPTNCLVLHKLPHICLPQSPTLLQTRCGPKEESARLSPASG
jgi:hypothetical protein